MNIIVNAKLNEFYPTLAKPTIKSYSSNICKVLEIIKSNNPNDLYIKYKEIIKKVKEAYPEIGSQKCKYSSSVSFIKMLLTDEINEINENINEAKKSYNDEIEIINKKCKEQLSKFTKTEKEEKAWLSDDDKKKIEEVLESKVPDEINNIKDLKHFRNLIIFKFFNDLASRCEVSLSKLYYDDEIENIDLLSKDYNYIILKQESRTIDYIRNQHKNVNKKGAFTSSLDKDLYDIFEKYKTEVEKFNNDNWFLLNDNGNRNMSYKDLSYAYRTFGDIIDKSVSIRVNRKIKASKNVNMEKVISESYRMGHTPQIALSVYAKQ